MRASAGMSGLRALPHSTNAPRSQVVAPLSSRARSCHGAPTGYREQVTIFLGPMWSSKSSALLQAVEARRALYARVVVVKHAFDTRHPTHVVSRTGLSLPADVIAASLDDVPLEGGGGTVLYAVDEAQFHGESLPRFHARLRAAYGADFGLVVAGLDLDFARVPFEGIARLADECVRAGGAAPASVHRLVARCGFADCHAPAAFSQRLGGAGDGARLLVGDAESYRPACAAHHTPHAVPAAGGWQPEAGAGAAGVDGAARKHSGAPAARTPHRLPDR